MTDDDMVVCTRCGFRNVPGDQFCGSCGAFLEWEGRPGEAGPPGDVAPGAGGAPIAADDNEVWPPVPADRAPTEAWPPKPAPRPAPAPGAAAASAGAERSDDADLVRCPACGIANSSTRTFCQSCGTRLVDAAPVGGVSEAQIAAAVSARPEAGWAGRPSASPPVRVRSQARRSGGIPGWLLAVAGLGIVAGIGFVVLTTLLGSPGPGTGATSAPSGGNPSSAPSGGPSSAPSAGPVGPSVELAAKSAKASSVIGKRPKFAATMVIDGDPTTCWQEGAKTEKGQWVEVTFDPARLDAVVISNGYQLSDDSYFANHRLKKVVITVNGGHALTVTLADTMDPQRIELGGIEGAKRLRIEIVSVYKSEKTSYQDSPFDDAALGEVVLEGVPQ